MGSSPAAPKRSEGGSFPGLGCGFMLQPDGLIHTSPGHRPGWGVVVGGQAESLHHTWLVGSAVYEADFHLAMCFLTCDPGRRPKDSALPRADMADDLSIGYSDFLRSLFQWRTGRFVTAK